jgi:hypothetical protein
VGMGRVATPDEPDPYLCCSQLPGKVGVKPGVEGAMHERARWPVPYPDRNWDWGPDARRAAGPWCRTLVQAEPRMRGRPPTPPTPKSEFGCPPLPPPHAQLVGRIVDEDRPRTQGSVREGWWWGGAGRGRGGLPQRFPQRVFLGGVRLVCTGQRRGRGHSHNHYHYPCQPSHRPRWDRACWRRTRRPPRRPPPR